ncbi:carbon-nitrogen hydrolase [Asanoa ishikariensis]|uniref:Predicted amidohydrolase n=1 Tax=Asanoa ishikariensis TaxID=137265 RepID=A0A1H3TPU0_9ACTN|nr:carbon-nitrogen hydrolase family protein [Asanoa ishikariensis]GIF62017.1 carbon-nitrogen hydrolase [Asanoa ishikariensis]SDZ52216.1 Predicted amidohydrolase [Asanoa ishikariensis]
MHPLPPEPLTVAAGQATCVSLDVAANVATAAALVRQAAGAAVLVLPELFLTGYELAVLRSHAVEPDDDRLEPLAKACAETGTAVVIGAPVVASGQAYISALVFDRSGSVVGRYDKQRPTATERVAGATAGAHGCTLEVDGWRLGLGICADTGFPEHARAAALDGCHAYLVGAMFNPGRSAHRRATQLPARAQDNTCYAVLANHSGRSGPLVGCGGSAIWNPDGTLLTDAGAAEPAVAIGRLDPEVLALARADHPVLTEEGIGRPERERRTLSV